MLQIIVCNFEMHFICTMDFEYEVQFVKFSICYILLTCSFFFGLTCLFVFVRKIYMLHADVFVFFM